jgi:hypothetical protein
MKKNGPPCRAKTSSRDAYRRFAPSRLHAAAPRQGLPSDRPSSIHRRNYLAEGGSSPLHAGPYEIRIVEDRWATFRHIIEAVAIVAAGAWAFYTLVYQEKLKPQSQPASLSLDVSMYEMSHTARLDIVGVKLSFRNSGQTEIDVAADGFSVWGERFGHAVVERRHEMGPFSAFDRDLASVSTAVVRSSMELRDMAVGGYAGNHIIMEPADIETLVYTIAIPHGTYDLLYARVIAVPLKTSQAEKIPVAIRRQSDGSYWLSFRKDFEGIEDDNDAFFSVPQ